MITEYRGRIPFLLKDIKGNIVYLCSSNKNIEDYYNTLSDFYDGKILKIESSYENEEFEKLNYDLLKLLKSKNKFAILISLEAFLRDYALEGDKLSFKKGKEMSIAKIQEDLVRNKYDKVYMIEKRMQYSVRGDILDIFSSDGDYPVRIEFFGDEIERIAYFDLESQKSIEILDSINVYINNNKNGKISFFDLVKNSKTKGLKIYFENNELLRYKLEENIIREREEEEKFRGRFNELLETGEEVEIKRFSEEEIKKFEDYDYIKKLSQKENILLMSEEEKRYKEIFENYNIEIERYPHYEGYREKDRLILTESR